MRRMVLMLSMAALLAGCGRRAPDPDHLGTATMRADGAIVLRMREGVTGFRGAGQGVVVVMPGEPHYATVLENVGPMEPGQTVTIRRRALSDAEPALGPHDHHHPRPELIGWATLREDGTLVLELDAEHLEGGGQGRRVFTYPRGHREYRAILRQLPKVKPGEQVPVPPELKLEGPPQGGTPAGAAPRVEGAR